MSFVGITFWSTFMPKFFSAISDVCFIVFVSKTVLEVPLIFNGYDE